ncbi:MAG: hypothetical protein WDN10_04415 [bacterium]
MNIATIIRVSGVVLPDVVDLIGRGTDFWKGPLDGDGRDGDYVRDLIACDLAEIDTLKLTHDTFLVARETAMTGLERLQRLEALRHKGWFIPGAALALAFKERPSLYPSLWKEPVHGSALVISFDGQVFRSVTGKPCTIHSHWDGRRVNLHYSSLLAERGRRNPSALLKAS